MSIAKGIVKTAENVVKMNADTMQIFSRNPRGSNYKDPTVREAEEFQRIRREAGFGAILAHAPYTMNLASAKPEVYEFACTVIREDVTRMDKLGIENLVFHPGSHTGIGAEAGIQNIIAGLDQAITGKENITVTYPQDLGDKEKMREWILRERQIELAFEGDRFWTLARRLLYEKEENRKIYRMNVLADDQGQGFAFEGFYERKLLQTRYWDNKMYLYPIAQTEIDRGRGLVQNPGW